MGFYFNQKDQVLNPLTVLSWLQPVDRSVNRSLKAVDRSVDRRAHTCTPVLAGWPVDRPGRPSREQTALWKGPGRPTGRPDRETCSLYPGLGRPTGRPMAQRSKI